MCPFPYFLLYIFIYIELIGAICDEGTDFSRDLDRMNEELERLNQILGNFEWQIAVDPSQKLLDLKRSFSDFSTSWKNNWCEKLRCHRNSALLPARRMVQLLCRGPKYTPSLRRDLESLVQQMSLKYATAVVCKDDGESCFHGEPDLARLVSKSRNESELRWVWISWRKEMSSVKEIFKDSVRIQNLAARSNGYHDIGECWREELGPEDIQDQIDVIYETIQPLYQLLHGLVRHHLSKIYPEQLEDPRGPIPAHLLGNLWSENWESLQDLLLPDVPLNLTEAMLRKNYTVGGMVKRAEDFYVSLGLPRMTEAFWRNSIFERRNTSSNCHASAANMYRKDDFRILSCLQVNEQDLSVVYHEMGHIHYYMAYQDQPAIFRNGANTAFQESIGDAVMYGVLTPQHLVRLDLVDDGKALKNPLIDLAVLLKNALTKLPQLAHGIAMEKWRWDVFSGKIPPQRYNEAWWSLMKKFMGIQPPPRAPGNYFDPAAKFHVAGNIPYARYLLAQILQLQLFEAMCQVTITGKSNNREFNVPLHRCDIYGSKGAGKLLRSMMRLGNSVHWKYALYVATGKFQYDGQSLLNYYKPLYRWLKRQIDLHEIPVGWE